MTKPRPPYLIRRSGRQGETLWYYWKRPGKQIRIRGEYGSREFWGNYERASNSVPVIPSIRKPPESLGWLLDNYRRSSVWSDLSSATRRQRDNIFHRVLTANPTLQYADIDRALITRTRDAKAQTPSEANNFLNAMRGLFRWAVDAGHLDADPTAGIKNVRRPRSGGFPIWTDEDQALFERRWPIGTRERLAYEIMLATGLRRGDVARLGKQHFKDGRLRIVTEKTGTQINIPVHEIIQQLIDATDETGDLCLFVSAKTGNPMTKEGFGNWFGKISRLAGVTKNCHGLRKAAATNLAEAGATIHEMNAVFGWSGTTMASLYTEKANREKLANSAAEKLRKKD